MRRCLSILAVVLVAAAGLGTIAMAEGQVLPGCFAFKGNEKQFQRTMIEWRANKSGETMVVYAVVNVEDKAAVCGMYLNEGVVPESELKRMLALGKIKSGRQVLVGNLSYFKNACKAGKCKLCAPCFMTPLDWKLAYGRTKPKFVPGVDVPAR